MSNNKELEQLLNHKKKIFSILLLDEIKLNKKNQDIIKKIFSNINCNEKNFIEVFNFISNKSNDNLLNSNKIYSSHYNKIKSIQDQLNQNKNISIIDEEIRTTKKIHKNKIKEISKLIKENEETEKIKPILTDVVELFEKKKKSSFFQKILIDFNIGKKIKKIKLDYINDIDDCLFFHENVKKIYSKIKKLKKEIIKSRQNLGNLKKEKHYIINLNKDLFNLKSINIESDLKDIIINELYENKNLKTFMDNIDLNINYHFLVSNFKKINEIKEKKRNIDYDIHEIEKKINDNKPKRKIINKITF